MHVSVIIPTYNENKMTVNLVHLFKDFYPSWQIIIVDNASDTPYEKVQSEEVIILQENKGITEAWNKGLSQATGDVIVFVNNDIDSIQDLKILVESCFESGAVSFPRFTLGEDRTRIYEQEFVGFCFAVRKDKMELLGPFDENMWVWYSDIDFFYRCIKKHVPMRVIPQCIIHHFGSKTLSRVDWTERIEQDKKNFADKWNFDPTDKDLLAVCIPVQGRDLPLEFVISLNSLTLPINHVKIFVADTLTDKARTLLAEKAIEIGASKILWLDSDMVFEKDLYQKLASHKNISIVAALAYNSSGDACSYLTGEMSVTPNTGLQKVKYTGLAAVLMETRVFNFLSKPYFYFTKEDYEDINFSRDISKYFNIYCDTDLIIGHLQSREII